MGKKILKCLKVLGIILGVLLVVVIGYVIYAFATYYRLDDNIKLTVESADADSSYKEVNTGEIYTITTYNIGFGAYSPEFSFFMDGGTQSRAKSKESDESMVKGAGQLISGMNTDFALFQEVDTDSDRSYHINQYELLKTYFDGQYSVFAQNYDSPYLFYPITKPHGKSKSGIVTFSKYEITDSLRRKFPVATSLKKILDLDRCYTISRVPVANGKELVIINLHASAYGTDDSIREGQISMLCEDLKKEYEAGNYVVCGGDFNHNLTADENDMDSVKSWAYPYPKSKLPEHFSFALDSEDQSIVNVTWDSARDADIPYTPGESYTVTLDGFIVSDNVKVDSYLNYNSGFKYSDHDPVVMIFELTEE